MMQNLRERLFTLQPQRLTNEEQAELGQTKVRIVMLAVIATYITIIGSTVPSPNFLAPWAKTILIYYAFYTPAALALVWWVQKVPGHLPVRRLIAMTLDYVSLGFSIVVATHGDDAASHRHSMDHGRERTAFWQNLSLDSNRLCCRHHLGCLFADSTERQFALYAGNALAVGSRYSAICIVLA